MSTDVSMLRALADQSEALSSTPTIHRGPAQLLERLNAQRVGHRAREAEIGARQLLDDLVEPNYYSKLNKSKGRIHVEAALPPIEPIHEGDLDGFLNEKHRDLLLFAVEDARRGTLERFESSFSREMSSFWGRSKRKYLEDLGGRTMHSRRHPTTPGSFNGPASPFTPVPSPFAAIQPSSGVSSSTPIPNGGVDMDASKSYSSRQDNRSAESSGSEAKVVFYASKVQDLVECRKNGAKYPLIRSFADCRIDDQRYRKDDMQDNWELLKYLIKADTQGGDEPEEKCFLQSRNDNQLHFVQRSIAFLEDNFWSSMNAKNIRKGGTMRDIDTVEGYMQARRMPASDWAVIFYCLRAGRIQAAIEKARRVSEELVSFLQDYEEERRHGVSSANHDHIAKKFKEFSSSDRYKLAVYQVLGRIQERRGETVSLFNTCAQDYMWIKLLDVEDEGQLHELQQKIAQTDSKRFKPLLYFMLLILTQQFERGIEFLVSDSSNLKVEAMHFAIALYYYGLLRQPQPGTETLVSESNGLCCLNMEYFLKEYVSYYFLSSNPFRAALYMFLLQNDYTRQEALRDLVISHPQLLSASAEAPNLRHLFRNRHDVLHLAISAANYSREIGRWEDAVRLFDIAEQYDVVLDILNEHLDRVLSQYDNEKNRIRLMADQYRQKYETESASLRHWRTFTRMLNLAEFFNLTRERKYLEALKCMENINLLPLSNLGDIRSEIELKRSQFMELDDCIVSNISDVLACTMDCIVQQYHACRSQPMNVSLKADMKRLRAQAHSLESFAGAIQLKVRVPPDVLQALSYQRASIATYERETSSGGTGGGASGMWM